MFSEIKRTLCDTDSMRSPNYVSLTFSTLMFGVSDTIPFLFLPSKAIDMNLSRELSAMLISTIGFTSITGRIGIGILTGKSQHRRLISFILAFLVCSASMAIYARANTYIIFIVGSCCFGVSTGLDFIFHSLAFDIFKSCNDRHFFTNALQLCTMRV